MDFIPVKLIEEHKHMINALELEVAESGLRTFAPNMYSFPKIDEPQKVVVPQSVAEWIDTLDKHGLFGLNYDVVDESVWDWVYENYDCNVKKLHLAYLYGYEIEQEKLYTVEIPDPYGQYKIRYLFKNSVGDIRIGGNNYRDIFLNTETHLTEAEIKQDFDWAWQWAEPVEEE